MKNLMILDQKDYSENMPVFERHAVRAVIMKAGQLAMQKGSNGEYKFPGGKIEGEETNAQALIREVQEEVGLVVIEESMKEIGEILEIRKDLKMENTKYISYSYYYSCSITDEVVECNMTQSEIEKGLQLAWVDCKEAYESNLRIIDEEWKMRDTKFLKQMLDGKITLD